MWKITLRKHRATWHYFTENPQGGGSGSNICGPKYIALARATQYVPVGANYELWVNDALVSKGIVEEGFFRS